MNMETIIKILKMQQVAIVAGLVTKECYSLFARGIDYQWREILAQNRCYPVMFFSSDSARPFYKNKAGVYQDVTPLSLKSETVSMLFLPLKSGGVPASYIYIVPSKAEEIEELSKEWGKRVGKLIWIQSFPYAQLNSVLLLKDILQQSWLKCCEVSLCLLKTGRRFGESDLFDENKAIGEAETEYRQRQLVQTVTKCQIPISERDLKQLVFPTEPISDIVLRNLVHQVEGARQEFNNFFEIDYSSAISPLLDPNELDQLFQYDKKMGVSKKALRDHWNRKIDGYYKTKCKPTLEAFALYFIHSISLRDSKEEMNVFFEQEWHRFSQKANNLLRISIIQSQQLNQSTEWVLISHSQIAWKCAFASWLEEELRKNLGNLLKDKLQLWTDVFAKNEEAS